MGIDSEALEVQEAQMSALSDVRKKWHIQPAFSVEFIGYFLDRITRLRDIKSNLEVQVSSNAKLVADQQYLKEKYDQMIRDNEELAKESETLREKIQTIHSSILSLCPNKVLPLAGSIGKPAVATSSLLAASAVLPCLTVPLPASTPPARPMSVPTAAALKMGVGFPLQNPSTTNNAGKILSTQRPDKNELLHECGICKRCTDQHLLAKCDTCHFHYHLGCLNPPLTRHPKKGKLYGWQCSECDKSDCSDTGMTMPEGPRKSRTRYSKDGTIVSANSAPPSPPPPVVMAVVAKVEVEVKEETVVNKSVNGGKLEGEEPPPPVPLETAAESIKVEPIIIPKMKITPTRGRGRGRGRGRPPGRKSHEGGMSSNGSSSRSEAQSPTSLPVSIPVVWPTNLSPVVAPTGTAAVSTPAVIPQEPLTTPKASKSEKRRAKKEKKHHHKLQAAAANPSPPHQPVYYIAPEKISSQEAAEDAEDEEDTDNDVPETNESIVDKNLMNLSHELSQSNADTSAVLNTTTTTTELDGEDKANHHRKKKSKEKHKNKSHDSDASKEHKRKRKRKYGMENTTEEFADVHGASHPRIKIKFKAIPLPGTSSVALAGVEGDKQFVYMSAEQSPKRVKSPYKLKSPDHGMRSPIKQIVSILLMISN